LRIESEKEVERLRTESEAKKETEKVRTESKAKAAAEVERAKVEAAKAEAETKEKAETDIRKIDTEAEKLKVEAKTVKARMEHEFRMREIEVRNLGTETQEPAEMQKIPKIVIIIMVMDLDRQERRH